MAEPKLSTEIHEQCYHKFRIKTRDGKMNNSHIRRLSVLRSHIREGSHFAAEDHIEGRPCQAQYVSLNSDQKFITAEEAAGLVPDGATITVSENMRM